MAGKRHVIVGSGTAGLNAIRTLRQSGDTGDVVLVSLEPPYSRMVLPYFLEQRISQSHVTTATPRQLDHWQVDCRIGRRVAGLDTQAGYLTLEQGDDVSYDDLLIATGSSAVRPPIPGADSPGVFNFWDLADAQAVHNKIHPAAHVVMVGAGFISFTILNGILQRSGRLTIVEVAPRILPRMVDDDGAGIAAKWLEAQGVTLRTGAVLNRIENRDGQLHLAFEKGEAIEADLVVMATGIRPNLDWLQGSGLEINQGILVDDHLRSNVANVYAAGDVAEARNRVTGSREVHAIEPTAMEHGRVVGANMAGKDVAYAGSLLMNIVSVGGLDMASFGTWDDPGADIITGLAPERSAYRKYLLRDGRLVGAIMIGRSQETWSDNDLGMLKGLVLSGADLTPWVEYLRNHPFEVKKPFLASHITGRLLPQTILGAASPPPAA